MTIQQQIFKPTLVFKFDWGRWCSEKLYRKVYQWKNRYVRYRCCVHNNNGNAHCTNSVTVDEQELLNEVKSYLLTAIEDKKAFADKLMKQYQKQTTNVDVSEID